MRVLAFRHVPFEGAGRLENVLAKRGIALEYVDLYNHPALLPAVSDSAGLVFLGGPMSVNDVLPYLDTESKFIQQAIDLGHPVLGICLGAQLIAKTLGARVYPNPAKEIGWFDITLTEAGRKEPLFKGMRGHETVFHWHGETFDLPPGATLLASSDLCPNQAFRLGPNTYGMQFHLEATPEMITDWCMQDANCGDVRELHAPIDAHRNAQRLEDVSDLVFGHWANLL